MLCLCVFKVVDSQNKIEGIGIFKIGKTKIKIINQILEENKVVLENFDNIKQSRWLKYRIDFVVAELTPNITDDKLNPLLTCFCPDVRVFFIKEYKIAGINLQNIHLKFYKNTLIAFYCDSSDELLQSLTTKYGNPKRIENWDKASGFSKLDNVNYSSLYWNNDSIFASFNYETDALGKKNSYFIVRDLSLDNNIAVCEIKKKETYLNDLRKKVLNDLQKKVLKDL